MKSVNRYLARLSPAYGRFLFKRAIRKIAKVEPTDALLAYDARKHYPPIAPFSESLNKRPTANAAAENWRRICGGK